MRRMTFGLGLIAMLIATPVLAQTNAARDENLRLCGGSDIDAVIAGCTALLQPGQEIVGGTGQSQDYLSLGNAYLNKSVGQQDPAKKKGYLDQAIANFTLCIANDFKMGEARGLRGVAHADKGEVDPAIEDFTYAIISGGTLKANQLSEVYEMRANLFRSQGHTDQAILDYRAAVRIDPTNNEAKDDLKSMGVAP